MNIEHIIEGYVDEAHILFVCDRFGRVVHETTKARQAVRRYELSTQSFLPTDHIAFVRKVLDDAIRMRSSHPLILNEVKKKDLIFEYTYTARHGFVVLLCRDVTETKKRENELLERALYDEVTGVPNRVYFLDTVEQEIIKSDTEPGYLFGLSFLDLNDFKTMNDVHGHAFGDKYLKMFAELLISAVGDSGSVFRYAGDEFIVLTKTRTYEKLSFVMKSVASVGSDFHVIDGVSVTFSASIGCVLYRCGMSAKDILDLADKAMYESKKRKHIESFPYTLAT